eukprot:2130402-Amphidinium_carterae.2
MLSWCLALVLPGLAGSQSADANHAAPVPAATARMWANQLVGAPAPFAETIITRLEEAHKASKGGVPNEALVAAAN